MTDENTAGRFQPEDETKSPLSCQGCGREAPTLEGTGDGFAKCMSCGHKAIWLPTTTVTVAAALPPPGERCDAISIPGGACRQPRAPGSEYCEAHTPSEARCPRCFETRTGGAGACGDAFHGAGEEEAGRPDIEGIRRLVAEATPAPWIYEAVANHDWDVFYRIRTRDPQPEHPHSPRFLAEMYGCLGELRHRGQRPEEVIRDNEPNRKTEADAKLLSSAPRLLAGLCDYVEHIERQRDQATREAVRLQRLQHAAEAERDAAEKAARLAERERDAARTELGQARGLGLAIFDSGAAAIGELETKVDNAEALCVAGEKDWAALVKERDELLAALKPFADQFGSNFWPKQGEYNDWRTAAIAYERAAKKGE